MAISEVKNLTGGAVRDSHVKLFIAFEPYFLSEILNLGGLVLNLIAKQTYLHRENLSKLRKPKPKPHKHMAQKPC